MNDWRKEMESALETFITVAKLAGEPVSLDELQVEFCSAPHKQPSSLPIGKMAIYAFWSNGEWLKIGKAGGNSGPRYVSQHYTGSAMSTLAGSLSNDPQMSQSTGFDKLDPGKWIKASTCRVNILISSNRRRELLSLLEAFLHTRLNPKYEG
jgi:hypothetical protein